MTNTSLLLLVAVSCCLFFGSKCASTLESDEPNPRRHGHADVRGGPLQLFKLGGSRQHAHERLALIGVVQDARTTARILPGDFLLGPGPGSHGVNYAIKSFRSTGLAGSSERVDMVML